MAKTPKVTPKYRFPADPPKEALAYFRAKGIKPGFDYRDVWRDEHATAFTVAKAMELDVLETIRDELDRVKNDGLTLAQFQKDLTPTLQKLGWWGKQTVVDPLTGVETIVQLGSPQRLNTIYDVNMRQARHAGKWQRIERTKRGLPYLLYKLGPSREHRPDHQSWNNLLLRVDDPFWHTHYPMNGYGCKCWVRQISQREYDRLKGRSDVSTHAPIIKQRDWLNKRTGKVMRVPEGIDPGFDHNPGLVARREHLARVFTDKLPQANPAIAAAVMAQSIRFLLPSLSQSYRRWTDEVLKAGHRAQGEVRVVGALATSTLAWLTARQQLPQSAAITVTDRELLHIVRDSKKDAGRALAVAELQRLPEIVSQPQAVLWDKRSPALVYVINQEEQQGKVVVRVDYKIKARDDQGKRVEVTTNSIRTGGIVPLESLQNKGWYELISGSLGEDS